MANELRARFNFVSGTLSSSLTNVATSMSSAGLANLGVIDATNHAAITIENEIVWVTAHTGGATTATIVRGKEGTTGAAHSSAVAWQHGPTAFDLSFLANPPSCRVFHSATQSVPDNGFLDPVLFNSESHDTDAMHSTSVNTGRITINTAGVYTVTFNFQMQSGTDYPQVRGQIFLNGATFVAGASAQNNTGGGYEAWLNITSAPIKLAVNDFLSCSVYQDNTAGAARNVNATSCIFGATWVGGLG